MSPPLLELWLRHCLWRLNGAPEVKFDDTIVDCKFQELSIVFLIAFLAVIVFEIYLWGFLLACPDFEEKKMTFFDLW